MSHKGLLTDETLWSPATPIPVVLNYGLGVDSTAILVRWLKDPSSRRLPDGGTFDLRDLMVITAMTGDEWESTGELVETHLLPLLRLHNVRFVQVARADYSATEGYTLLDDSRQPQRLYLAGHYKLSDELLARAVVPQSGNGLRHCSEKQKAAVINKCLPSLIGRRAYWNILGFDTNEQARADRGSKFNRADHKISVYPLIEWGWDRQRSIDYLYEQFGVQWLKSACVYCPFAFRSAGGRLADPEERRRALMDANRDMFDRFLTSPRAVIRTLSIEYGARCINPSQTLRVSGSVYDLFVQHGGFADALARFADEIAVTPHHISDVRRVMRSAKRGDVYRSILHTETGSQADMVDRLTERYGARVAYDGVTHRVPLRSRPQGTSTPWAEHNLVVTPHWIESFRGAQFDERWQEVTGEMSGLPAVTPRPDATPSELLF